MDAPLPWPESVASYEIVKSGEASESKAPRYIFGALGFGGLIEILTDDKGAQIFREYVEGFLRFPRSVIQHFDFEKKPIGDVTHFGGIPWSTPSLSPALIGIGYIIGPELSCINVSGGIIAWWILIPLLLFFDPDLPRRIGTNDPAVAANSVWFNVVRPIAVGTMLVGAASTMYLHARVAVEFAAGNLHRFGRRGSRSQNPRSHRARHSAALGGAVHRRASDSDHRASITTSRTESSRRSSRR